MRIHIKYFYLMTFFFIFVFIGTYYSQTTYIKHYDLGGNDLGFNIHPIQSGNYIITGQSSHGLFLMEVQPNGDTLWSKKLPSGTKGISIKETFNGNFLIAGNIWSSNSFNIGLWKSSSSGNILSTRVYGGPEHESVTGMDYTDDGNLLICASSGTMSRTWLLKVNSDGDTLWTKIIQSIRGYEIINTNDSGFALIGSNGQITLLKINSNGDSLWQKSYGPSGGYAVNQTSDNGFILAGKEHDNFAIIKTDSAGNQLWTKTYKAYIGYTWWFSTWSETAQWSIIETSNNDYLLVASDLQTPPPSNDDVVCILTSSEGDSLWKVKIGETSMDMGFSCIRTQDDYFLICGSTKSFGAPNDDVLLIKMDTLGVVGIDKYLNGKSKITEIYLFQNFPNPFNPYTTINYNLPKTSEVVLTIYNTLGEKVKLLVNGRKSAGIYEEQWDGKNEKGQQVSSGIYLYQLKADGFVQTRKMLLLR